MLYARERFNLNTSTGTQDLTISGLGWTPKAAFVTAVRANLNDTVTANCSGSFGLTDGTNQYCLTWHSADNVSTSDANTGCFNDRLVRLLLPTATVDGEADFDSFISGGIRIDITDAMSNDFFVIVDMFGGDDAEFHAGDLTVGQGASTENVTTVGFEPDWGIFLAGNNDFVDQSEVANLIVSFGCVDFTGTIEQRGYGFWVDDGETTTSIAGYLHSSAVIQRNTGAVADEVAVSDPDSSGFTATWSGPAATDINTAYLVARSVSQPFVDSVEVATATGNNSNTDPGFHPVGLMKFTTPMNLIGEDDLKTGNLAGAFGVGGSDGTRESSASWHNENNATTTDSGSFSIGEMTGQRDHVGDSGYQATFVSFDDNGWTENYSDVRDGANAPAQLVLCWAEVVLAAADLQGDGSVTATLTGDGALSASVSGTGSVTATATGDGALSASLFGAGSLTATLIGDGALAGTVSGAGAITATMTGGGAVVATVSGAGSVTASMSGDGALAATLSGSGSVTAALNGDGALEASLSGAGSVAATIAGDGVMAATLDGAGSLTATLSAADSLIATLSGSGSITASMSGDGALIATVSATGTLTATLAGADILDRDDQLLVDEIKECLAELGFSATWHPTTNTASGDGSVAQVKGSVTVDCAFVALPTYWIRGRGPLDRRATAQLLLARCDGAIPKLGDHVTTFGQEWFVDRVERHEGTSATIAFTAHLGGSQLSLTDGAATECDLSAQEAVEECAAEFGRSVRFESLAHTPVGDGSVGTVTSADMVTTLPAEQIVDRFALRQPFARTGEEPSQRAEDTTLVYPGSVTGDITLADRLTINGKLRKITRIQLIRAQHVTALYRIFHEGV